MTANPARQSVRAGGTTVFQAAAQSNAQIASVEWLVSTNDGSTFSFAGSGDTNTTSTGTATTTLQVFNTTAQENGNVYEAVFSNAFGTVTTVPATLTVAVTPTPASITPLAGTSDQQAAVNNPLPINLAVLVTDASGNPLPNVVVTFTAPAGMQTGGTFPNMASTATATTDSHGDAVAPVFTANSLVGPYQVVASVNAGALTTDFSLSNYTPGKSVAVHPLSSEPLNVVVGQTATPNLAVTVTDAHGRPVPGISVTFAAPAFTIANGKTSTASGTFAAATGSGTAKFTVSTNAGGVATAAAFAANDKAGIYSIKITAGTLTASLKATNVPDAPASLTPVGNAANQTAMVGRGFAVPLAVLVEDQFQNVIVGRAVTFSAPTTGASGVFPGLANSVTVVTKANGIATAPRYTANDTAGTDQVTVSTGTLAANLTLTNKPDVAFAIEAVQGSTPQSSKIGLPFPNPLAVLVTDVFGNPVQTGVFFSAPTQGASGTFVGGATTLIAFSGTDGIASTPFTANQIVSANNLPYIVSAEISFFEARRTAFFSLTNLARSNAMRVAAAAPPPNNLAFAPLAVHATQANRSVQADVRLAAADQAAGLAARVSAAGDLVLGVIAAVANPPDAGMSYVAAIWLYSDGVWRQLTVGTLIGPSRHRHAAFRARGTLIEALLEGGRPKHVDAGRHRRRCRACRREPLHRPCRLRHDLRRRLRRGGLRGLAHLAQHDTEPGSPRKHAFVTECYSQVDHVVVVHREHCNGRPANGGPANQEYALASN